METSQRNLPASMPGRSETRTADAQPSSAWTQLLFVVYLLVLVGVVMFKLPFYSGMSSGTRVINLVPFAGSFDHGGHLVSNDVAYNVLVFVPLGIYLSVLTTFRLSTRLLLIFGTTLMFELGQFVFAIGVADVTDVLSNTAGGIIGLGIHAVLRGAFRQHTVRAVNVSATMLTILALVRFGQMLLNSYVLMGRPPR